MGSGMARLEVRSLAAKAAFSGTFVIALSLPSPRGFVAFTDRREAGAGPQFEINKDIHYDFQA
jgi:hypothetical protein